MDFNDRKLFQQGNGIEFVAAGNELPIDKGIGISFSSFCLNLPDGFEVPVNNCRFGTGYSRVRHAVWSLEMHDVSLPVPSL